MMDKDKMAQDKGRTMPMEKDKMAGEGGTDHKAHLGHKIEVKATTDAHVRYEAARGPSRAAR